MKKVNVTEITAFNSFSLQYISSMLCSVRVIKTEFTHIAAFLFLLKLVPVKLFLSVACKSKYLCINGRFGEGVQLPVSKTTSVIDEIFDMFLHI